MDIIAPIAMAAGLGWASGLRLYAVLFFLGALGWFGVIGPARMPKSVRVFE